MCRTRICEHMLHWLAHILGSLSLTHARWSLGHSTTHRQHNICPFISVQVLDFLYGFPYFCPLFSVVFVIFLLTIIVIVIIVVVLFCLLLCSHHILSPFPIQYWWDVLTNLPIHSACCVLMLWENVFSCSVAHRCVRKRATTRKEKPETISFSPYHTAPAYALVGNSILSIFVISSLLMQCYGRFFIVGPL